MTFDIKRSLLCAATVALSLSMAACHGQSPASSSYIPAGSTGMSAPQFGDEQSLGRHRSFIISLCGNVIKIKLLGTVRCRFREDGYNGVFKLFNHVPGLLDLKPLIGNEKTNFLLGGLALGDGYFLVKDLRHHFLLVRVKIVLL